MFVKSYCLFGDHGSSVRLQVIFPSNCNEFRLSAFSSKGFEMGGMGGMGEGGGGGMSKMYKVFYTVYTMFICPQLVEYLCINSYRALKRVSLFSEALFSVCEVHEVCCIFDFYFCAIG